MLKVRFYEFLNINYDTIKFALFTIHCNHNIFNGFKIQRLGKLLVQVAQDKFNILY